MAAADEAELRTWCATAAAIDDGPIAFRYPRGDGVGVDMPERGTPLEIGKGRIVREGHARSRILSLRHAARRMPQGGRGARRATGSRPRSPMPASPSRSTPT